MKFSPQDVRQFEARGLTSEVVLRQLQFLKQGTAYVQLNRPATLGDGIYQLNNAEQSEAIGFFEQNFQRFKLVKFVPASGAATRMFKFLQTFLHEFSPETQTINAYINLHKAKELKTFLAGMDKLPFFKKIDKHLRKIHPGFEEMPSDRKNFLFIQTLLHEPPFAYSQKPKGLIPFHRYKNKIETPFEAHLHEAFGYTNIKGNAAVHFTVSQNHLEGFKKLQNKLQPKLETKYGKSLQVDFSFQHKHTDTVTVDLKNNPVKESDGQWVFRPGGHGALIQNLNELNADLVFIKNIDNIMRKKERKAHIHLKKVLGGWALQLQAEVFHLLKDFEAGKPCIDKSEVFLKEKLSVVFPENYANLSASDKEKFCIDKLNRPLRVCGMVCNEGEPGGGPFWVNNDYGKLSLQIVESAQVNKENAAQLQLLQTATHFNPVDLVCAITDYKGRPFDLRNFVDKSTFFIAEKNYKDLSVKALELPGLWNGAMARWNTVFVEVPIETFNPVKTVNDLLKPAHLG